MTELPKSEMDPAVRAFLDRLDAEDVPLLETTISITRKLVAFGQVGKWILVALFALVLGMAALGEVIQKIWVFLKNGLS